MGGAQSYVAQLLPMLRGRFDVTVAAWGSGPLQRAAAEAGANYVELRHVQRPLNAWRDLRGLLELVRLCRRVRPDIVHANSSKAGVLGRLAASLTRVPVRVFTVHGWAFKAHAGISARLYLWADRLMRPLTTMVVCVSESEREVGIASRTCVRAASVVIPNAVALRRSPTRAHGVPLLVTVGRLKRPKDFATLVQALAKIERDFRALVVGDGPDRDAVEQTIRAHDLGDRIELTGTRDDVDRILGDADVFVLASRSEGMPMSVLEAMAAGLPVVATAVGGVPELVVDGETGFLVPPGDAPALGRALERLIDDANLRRRLGEAGRRRAATAFALHDWQAAHLELYTALLARRGLPLPVLEVERREEETEAGRG